MSIKKSIMISDQTVNFLNSRSKEDSYISWSQGINSAVVELDAVYADLLPRVMDKLTSDDWQVILDTYSGCLLNPVVMPQRIASDIMDNYGVIEVTALPEACQNAVRTVHGMSQSEQLAIMHLVRRFWATQAKKDETLAEMVARLAR